MAGLRRKMFSPLLPESEGAAWTAQVSLEGSEDAKMLSSCEGRILSGNQGSYGTLISECPPAQLLVLPASSQQAPLASVSYGRKGKRRRVPTWATDGGGSGRVVGWSGRGLTEAVLWRQDIWRSLGSVRSIPRGSTGSSL